MKKLIFVRLYTIMLYIRFALVDCRVLERDPDCSWERAIMHGVESRFGVVEQTRS